MHGPSMRAIEQACCADGSRLVSVVLDFVPICAGPTTVSSSANGSATLSPEHKAITEKVWKVLRWAAEEGYCTFLHLCADKDKNEEIVVEQDLKPDTDSWPCVEQVKQPPLPLPEGKTRRHYEAFQIRCCQLKSSTLHVSGRTL